MDAPNPVEADQLLLLLGRSRSLISLDGGGEPDRRDVVASAILPALRQGAVGGEIEIRTARAAGGRCRSGDRRDWERDRRRRWIGIVVIARFDGGTAGESGDAKAEARRQRRLAEEIEGEGIVLRHWKSPCDEGRVPSSRRTGR